MNKSVRFLLVLFLAFIFCFIARGRCGGSADTFSTGEYNRLKLKADSAKVYCVDKGFNTNYCFLVDFCIHSGKKRFFVWDFRGDSVVYASLCAHGYGKTVLLPNLYSVMWREVIVLLWDAIKSVSVRIANGESTFIINCTDWNRRITMLSNV